MECIQETTNKSVHPIREYIIIEEFVKTMEIEEVTEMFYLLLINCSVSYISTDNTLSRKTKSLKHQNISTFVIWSNTPVKSICIANVDLGKLHTKMVFCHLNSTVILFLRHS